MRLHYCYLHLAGKGPGHHRQVVSSWSRAAVQPGGLGPERPGHLRCRTSFTWTKPQTVKCQAPSPLLGMPAGLLKPPELKKRSRLGRRFRAWSLGVWGPHPIHQAIRGTIDPAQNELSGLKPKKGQGSRWSQVGVLQAHSTVWGTEGQEVRWRAGPGQRGRVGGEGAPGITGQGGNGNILSKRR